MKKFYAVMAVLYVLGYNALSECVVASSKSIGSYQTGHEPSFPLIHVLPQPEDLLWLDSCLEDIKNRPIASQTMYQILRGKYNEITNATKKDGDTTAENSVKKNKPGMKIALSNHDILEYIYYIETLPITVIQKVLPKLQYFIEKNNTVEKKEILNFAKKYIIKTSDWHLYPICSIALPYCSSSGTSFAWKYPFILVHAYNVYVNMLLLRRELQEFNRERDLIFGEKQSVIKCDKQINFEKDNQMFGVKKKTVCDVCKREDQYIWKLNKLLRNATDSIEYSINNFKENLFEVALCIINSPIEKTSSIENSKNLTIKDVNGIEKLVYELQTLSLEIADIFERFKYSEQTSYILKEIVKKVFIQGVISNNSSNYIGNIYEYVSGMFANFNTGQNVFPLMLLRVFAFDAYSHILVTNKWRVYTPLDYTCILTGKNLIRILNQLSTVTNLFSSYLENKEHISVFKNFQDVSNQFFDITNGKKPFIE